MTIHSIDFISSPLSLPSFRNTRAPLAERRGYKNVFDAIIRIGREEGILALWRVR